mgnify:CR=1 FL=1
MQYNYDEWINIHNECSKSVNRICKLNKAYDKNKCISALCVMNYAMQDINASLEHKKQSFAELCFLIRNIDVIITCILDLNKILLNVSLKKQDNALSKCFSDSTLVHDFRTLRSLIIAHPIDTNFINEAGNPDTIYLRDVLTSKYVGSFSNEKFDYNLIFSCPHTNQQIEKFLLINRDIIPVIEDIINSIVQFTNKINSNIYSCEEKLKNTKLKIESKTITSYIISLDKELQKRYPGQVYDTELSNGSVDHFSIIYDCLIYVNKSFSEKTQKAYEKFLKYIKDELKRIEQDLQNMTYDTSGSSYFALLNNPDFAKDKHYAKEKMEYLKRSNKTSFTLAEISNETNSDELWGIQQFKILIPYIEEYFPVDTTVSDKDLYCEYIMAEYLSNFTKETQNENNENTNKN